MAIKEAPSSLGKYRIDTVIGRGAMGVVYKAFDPDIERIVAIKVLHPHLMDDEDLREELAARFKQEAKAGARCFHSCIVAVFEFGISEEDESYFIVMEYIEGIDLKSILKEKKSIEFNQATDVVLQVLDALDYAHKQGVVHRDIKPANIMLLSDGKAKVADFGVARMDTSDLTQAGFMVGTPSYMSPEGQRGEKVDQRSDLYSLAVVFYEMLTGTRFPALMPPTFDDLDAGLTKVIQNTDERLALTQLFSKAMHVDKDKRYESSEMFAGALKAIIPRINEDTITNDALAETIVGAMEQSSVKKVLSKEDSSELSVEVLAELEHSLVSYIGPMAGVLVKKYARKYTHIDELVTRLGEHIPDKSEQTLFRSRLTNSGFTSSSSASSLSAGSAGSVSSGAKQRFDVTDEELAIITKTLTKHAGPLASRIVKKAQKNAQNWEEFSSLLLAQLSPGVTKQELQSFMQKRSTR